MGRLRRNLIGVSVRECARLLEVSDTAIFKAIAAGRCARHPDGSVTVEAVRLGMSLTADPFRGGQREAGVFGEAQISSTVKASSAPVGEVPSPPASSKNMQGDLLAARTKTEQTRAEREQIELAKLKGEVADIAPMTRAVLDAMTACRSELMSLPDRLTPIVTPETDGQKVYAAIDAEVIRICQGLHDKLRQMAAQHISVTA